MGLYGKMPSVSYQDYPEARLIVLWGVNPGDVRHSPHAVPERGARSRRDARRDRSARDDARAAGRPLPAGPAGHRPRRRARAPSPPLRGRPSPIRRSSPRTRTGADQLREKARAVDVRARGRGQRRAASTRCARFAELYATRSPALVKCGWGLERNRNGGSAAAAVLALPAVGRQVRRARRRLLDEQLGVVEHRAHLAARSGAADARDQHESSRPRADRATPTGPPIKLLFVYNCNPAVTMPDQTRVLQGPRARGSVHRRLRSGDDRHRALRRRRAAGDDVPRALRLRRRSYGPITLQLARPVIDQVGESRSNPGGVCGPDPAAGARSRRRSRRRARGDAAGPRRHCPRRTATSCASSGRPRRRSTAGPIQFVDVLPRTADQKVHLFPGGPRSRGAARTVWISARPGDRAISRWR